MRSKSITGNENFKLRPQSSLTPVQRNIYLTLKVATPPQLKLKEIPKFKSTSSHFGVTL